MECKHENTEIIETPELIHYGKEVCKDCGRFIKWVSKPDKPSYKEECAFMLDRALKQFPDNSFVSSLSTYFVNNKSLSKKQFEALKRMLEE